MKMEVLAVQQQYQSQYGVLGSNKVKDWTSTLRPSISPPSSDATATAVAVARAAISNSNISNTQTTATNLPYLQNNTTNKIKNSITKKSKRLTTSHSTSTAADVGGLGKTRAAALAAATATSSPTPATAHTSTNGCYTTHNFPQNTQQTPFYCDDVDAEAVNKLSLQLLDELRAAKSRHLTCTEVSLPCDLTPRIAAELIRISEKEPCGIRGCTIYIEFEDEPNNSRRIASLKLDTEMVSTFEVYLTLRQDHRGWTALLPQFMKSLARTITISPEFTITKHKLYSPDRSSIYSYNGNGGRSNSMSNGTRSRSSSVAISTKSS